jgi:Dipeptidase
MIFIFFILWISYICNLGAQACTNILITPGASKTGDPIIAYNADSGNLMGMLYHYPSSTHNATAMRKIWNWDTGVYLGEIPEAKRTYNVVGNTNEHGLVIAETTFGGVVVKNLDGGLDASTAAATATAAKIDYGSLIYITLQRSKTARGAIQMMAKLMDTYGYASEGESFSIADRWGEVWIMEVIGKAGVGKGRNNIGSVWVAMRIPDGYISAHSNQARILTFPRDDEENCMYSRDVVDFAKEIGIYASAKDDPNDLKFSFSDVYDPVNFMGARASDARTWSIFSLFAEDPSFASTYEAYAMGKDPKNRMPLWIKPKEKLSMEDVMAAMANHYEGTAMAFDQDVGAGVYNSPYRPRPLAWKYRNVSYHNERAVATQQTGWNFVAQIRLNMPRPISSILWFAVDDSSTSPRFPVYGCSTAVSDAYYGKGTQDGVPAPLLQFDLGKAFWVQNMVSNLVYTRWSDAYAMVREKIGIIQKSFEDELHYVDQQLLAQYDHGNEQEMVRLATDFSVQAGDRLHKEWMMFYGDLFARLRDFYIVEKDPSDPICNCKVIEREMSDEWKQRIVKETGDKYQCDDDGTVPDVSATKLRRSKFLNQSDDKTAIQ